MYKLYRQQNGEVKQVLVEPTDIPPAPPQSREELNLKFPEPLDAKGQDVEPTFLEQEERQFDLIKQNETQQAKFQTQKLQWNNYQIVNCQITPTDSTDSQAYYHNNYNTTSSVGAGSDACIMFGTGTSGSDKAKYYNLVYANARLDGISSIGITGISFIEFYPLQKVPGGTFPGKIPRQIEAQVNNTGVSSISITGDEYGVQSFGIDLSNDNAYYTQSPDLKGVRCCGVALKQIQLQMSGSITINDIRINVELGYDLRTEGNNY